MHRSNPGRGSLVLKLLAFLGSLMVLVVPLFVLSTAAAQDSESDEVVIFVLDLSGSMNEPFDANRTKLDVAKAAFIEAFANVSPDARVGLRTYGDQIEPTTPEQREPSCTSDTRVVAAVAPLQRDQLIAQVQGFSALGDTPMGLAIQAASTDIPAGSTGTIVLFSDGRDECFDADLDGDASTGPSFGQDPCETAKAITNGDSAVDRIMTVGFRADTAAATELSCIADSTGGTYTPIETPEDARNVLPDLLVQLSAPREAQRLVGRAIQGTTATDTAPDLVRLDEVGADKVLYTDSIDMNSVRIYRMPSYGPEGGTFTATVFGLPPELGIALDMRIYVPSLDQRFFQGEQGDFDAGLPARPTASIRCTDCLIPGGPHEAFFVVTLDSEGPTIEGTYELELLTEGPGFGGPTTSCSAPQACFYPQEIINRKAELESVRAEFEGDIGELAPPELIAERDRLLAESDAAQEAIDAATARALELEELILLAPEKSNSFRLPLLMVLVGVGLALAPVRKLKRAPKDESAADAGTNAEDGDATSRKRKRRKKKDVVDEPESAGPAAMPVAATERTGPSLQDLAPAPAANPTLSGAGNNWDDELEAAKSALAKQRPDRAAAAGPATAASPTSSDDPHAPSAPAAETQSPHPQFTAAQHAAAQAAAQQIVAERAAKEAAQHQPIHDPASAVAESHEPAVEIEPAVQAATPEQIAALAAAAVEPSSQSGSAPVVTAAVEQDESEPIAAEPVAIDEAERAATEKAAAERAAAERAAQLATEQAARDETHRLAAQQAASQHATTEQAARETAERAAAEKAAAEQAAQIAAAEAAAEQAAQIAAAEAAEQAAREAAERAAAEAAAQAAAEQAAREEAQRLAAEKAAAEQAAREAAERAAAEKAAAEQAAREAAQRAAAEAAAQAAAEQAAREAAQRLAAEKAAAEQAAREAAERAAAEKAAAEQAAREAAERAAAEAAAQAAAEQAAREAAQRLAAEKAAAEQAAREAAERAAAEQAAAQKAAAERAAAEAAARAAAEQAAADRAAAERATAERAAAEKAAAEAAAQAIAERAAAEQAAADRVAAEKAAAEAAARREAAEKEALQAAALRAAEEAAAEAAAQAASAAEAAAVHTDSAAPMTEEEQRQEARRRMLAKQNIVASSSGPAVQTAPKSTAGTSAALRPMAVPSAASAPNTPTTPDAPGWYEDPAIVGQFRWWDGSTWTGHTAATEQEPTPS